MDKLAKKLNFKQLEDFYSLSYEELRKHGGRGLYNKYGSLGNLMKAVYPEYPMVIHINFELNSCFD